MLPRSRIQTAEKSTHKSPNAISTHFQSPASLYRHSPQRRQPEHASTSLVHRHAGPFSAYSDAARPWKAKRIRRGSPVIVWIDRKHGPAFIGKAEITSYPAVPRQIVEDYPKKYLMVRFGIHKSTQEMFDKGQVIAIKIKPVRDFPEGFATYPAHLPALAAATTGPSFNPSGLQPLQPRLLNRAPGPVKREGTARSSRTGISSRHEGTGLAESDKRSGNGISQGTRDPSQATGKSPQCIAIRIWRRMAGCVSVRLPAQCWLNCLERCDFRFRRRPCRAPEVAPMGSDDGSTAWPTQFSF